jgi:mycothiol synthase
MGVGSRGKDVVLSTVSFIGAAPSVRRFIELSSQAIAVAVEPQFDPAVWTTYEMRCELPMSAQFALVTRSFRRGVDEDGFLRVHRLASAGHPEIGLLDRQGLNALLTQPGVGPDSLQLYETEGVIAGYCLTRIAWWRGHRIGEIVAVALEPGLVGQGLGRDLVLKGLTDLYRRGAGVGLLYVDANNLRAVRLYISLGFQVFRVDRRYGLAPPPVI